MFILLIYKFSINNHLNLVIIISVFNGFVRSASVTFDMDPADPDPH